MRRLAGFVATVTAIAIGMGSGAVIAAAAGVDDPAPTDVQVAWTDAAHTTVRVTWQETGAMPNHVEFEDINGDPVDTAPEHQMYTAADEPNQLDLAVDRFPKDRTLRIGVFVGLPGQPHTSPGGQS